VLWEGEHTLVHLTVAPVTGGALDPSSQLYKNLSAAIDRYRDPAAKVRIASYEAIPFGVAGVLLVDPRYQSAAVVAAVKDALLQAFSFDRRDFAQSVTISQVYAVIQEIPGINACAIALGLNQQYSPAESIPSLPARWISPGGLPVMSPAQLLTIDPAFVRVGTGDQK